MNHNTITLSEIVNEALALSGDDSRKHFLRYKIAAKNAYRELNLRYIKNSVRIILSVNKEFNGIDLPENMITFSSINILKNGKLVPIVFSNSVKDADLIVKTESDGCGCNECSCQNENCGHLYSYEVVKELKLMKMPNNEPDRMFEQVLVKRIDKNGYVLQELTTPTLIYNESGIHTSTELVKETSTLCQLEVKKCGCIANSKENNEKLTSCGCSKSTEYTVSSEELRDCFAKRNLYNLSENGRRIYFDSNFDHKTVVLRCILDETNDEISIPLIAKDALLILTSYKANVLYDPRKANAIFPEYVRVKNIYSNVKDRMTIKEFIETVTPKKTTPSL